MSLKAAPYNNITEFNRMTKNSYFDDLCPSKVVTMVTRCCKDCQHIAVFDLFEGFFQVTVGKIFSSLAF